MRRALLALLLVCLPALARAQAPPDFMAEDDERVRFFVSWGFDGSTMIGERWTPVRVFITSGPRAVSGSVVVTYQQDASQSIRIEAPFATTPGVAVPVELALAIPTGCRGVSVRVQDERGRRLRARTFTRAASNNSLQMPTVLPSSGIRILSVGVDGVDALAPGIIAQDFSRAPPARPTQTDDAWSQSTLMRAQPVSLPSAWKAYDAVNAVILDAGAIDAVPAASREALRRWVHAGGTLVLVADAPGAAWRSVVGARTTPAPFTLGAPVTLEPTAPLADLVDPAPSLAARPVTVSPAGARAGWTRRWAVPGDASLLAEGPLGFGWLVVLGVDPARVPSIASDEQSARVWREILRPSMQRWVSELPADNWYWGMMGFEPSGATPRQRSAISSVLDHTLRAPTPGVGLFALLVAGVVLLAILVGPVDALVLKRLRKRQLSWATALAYIALACVPAALAPLLLRAGPTVYARARCVDVLPQGLGAGAAHTALSSTFSNAPGPVRVTDPAPGSWWRPVSALQSYGTAGVGAQLTCVQAPVSTPAGLVRQNTPHPDRGNAQRVWTLRALMDEAAGLPAPLATIDAAGERLRVTGLPRRARVVSGALVFPPGESRPTPRRQWAPLPAGETRSGVYELDLPRRDALLDEPPGAWAPMKVERTEPWRWQHNARQFTPVRLTHLPGAWQRTRAIHATLDAGAHALLLLHIEHDTPDATLNVRARANVLEVYRMLVPLPENLP